MALIPDSTTEDDKFSKLGIKVEGDLGELQIVETTDSECSDDESSLAIDQRSGAVQTLSNILPNVVQAVQAPVLSNVAVNNSENVQFGNNTYFHGPVTIKQIIRKKGIENASYTSSDNEHNSTNSSRDKPKVVEIASKKFNIPPWAKVILSVASVFMLCIICVLALYIQSHRQDDPPSNFDLNASVKETNYTKVVGMCHDNYQIILFTIIVVPITISLVLYSLLTLQSLKADQKTYRSNGVTEQPILIYPDADFNASIEPPVVKADPLLISPVHLRVVSRTDWLAQPVENELDKIRQPIPWVVITHTATEGCSNQSQCVLRVRLIQMFHIESKQWDDIGYNFLVAGDGSAYFGRGWDHIGAHTLGYNRYSLGIAFIGTFNNEPPPQKQIEACQKLIKLGVQMGKLAKDYKLFAHRQLASTLSPGDKLYDIIKEWPHFVKDTGDNKLAELAPKDY